MLALKIGLPWDPWDLRRRAGSLPECLLTSGHAKPSGPGVESGSVVVGVVGVVFCFVFNGVFAWFHMVGVYGCLMLFVWKQKPKQCVKIPSHNI